MMQLLTNVEGQVGAVFLLPGVFLYSNVMIVCVLALISSMKQYDAEICLKNTILLYKLGQVDVTVFIIKIFL
jgi:hypothetical protein